MFKKEFDFLVTVGAKFLIIIIAVAVWITVLDYACGIDFSGVSMAKKIFHDTGYLIGGAILFRCLRWVSNTTRH
jgi:hypothetical protein